MTGSIRATRNVAITAATRVIVRGTRRVAARLTIIWVVAVKDLLQGRVLDAGPGGGGFRHPVKDFNTGLVFRVLLGCIL